MNAFVDFYLRAGTAPRPTFDVGATVTRCLDHDAPLRYVSAPTWAQLHPDQVTFVSTAAGTTSSAVAGPAARATDPISTATLPLPGAYKGCRKVSPSEADPTAATYVFDARDDVVLMGGPVVDLTYDTTGPDTELNVRVWDVAPDGSVQGLVTRGTYRSLDGPGTGLRARFQVAPQGYRFPAGHRVKVEVAANDAPYYQASNLPAVVMVRRIEVVLPTLARSPATATRSSPAPAAAAAARRSGLPPTGASRGPGVGLLLLALAVVARRLTPWWRPGCGPRSSWARRPAPRRRVAR
jgi:hypothetical protein